MSKTAILVISDLFFPKKLCKGKIKFYCVNADTNVYVEISKIVFKMYRKRNHNNVV